MGKKPGGVGAGAGWLATVRKVFKPSKNQCQSKKRGGEAEGDVAGGGEAAEIVSVDHFPTAETSPEVTNDGSSGGAVAWRERVEQEEVAGARSGRRGMAAVTEPSRVAKTAAVRGGRARSREERAAVRIQAFYRGYLARRARRALRGLVRLQALVRGHQVRRQVHLTMRCMQALVRAQARVRARRLSSHPHAARRSTAQLDAQRRPGLLVDVVPTRQQHRGRLSYGHDSAGLVEIDHEAPQVEAHQAPQHHSSARSRRSLQGAWDAVQNDADGLPHRHDGLAASWGQSAPAYAYGLQHQRQLDESEDRDDRSGGWHWLEHCHTDVQANQHGPAETSYVTAAATDGVSENTVEMEADTKSPTRDLYPIRSPAIPGYMAATQSARAKARMAPTAAPTKAGARSRSSSMAPNRGSTLTANLGWNMSNNGVSGNISARAPQQRTGHSPESSCSGDRTPPVLGGRSRLAFA